MFGKRDKANPEKKRRLKLHEMTHENDIRYRGPINSQHFKLLGWLCIAAAQITVILRLGGRLSEGFAMDSASWLRFLESASQLSLPFLLIAIFAQLLNNDIGYRKTLLINGGAMAGICALYYLLFYRYIVGGVAAFLTNPSEALPSVSSSLGYVTPYGFLCFNLYVDLFLCALTMLFLNYTPRRVFVGKARFIFRLFALLPIAYEAVCMVLKVRSARGLVRIPVWAYPLLTVKPPMTFVLFVALVLFVKTRELRYCRHGRTHEEYRAFLQTRRNSLNFSVFLTIMIVVVSLVDIAVVAGFSLNEVSTSIQARARLHAMEAVLESGQELTEDIQAQIDAAIKNYKAATATPEGEAADPEATRTAVLPTPKPAQAAATVPEAAGTPAPVDIDQLVREALDGSLDEEEMFMSIDSGMRLAEAVGFGDSVSLLMLAPLILLFSYTRRPKYPILNMLIPVAGFILILFVYLEGIHQLLPLLPVGKVDVQQLKQMISDAISATLAM